jgi:hypothetical protein
MVYLDPFESNEQTLRNHGVLSRKQSNKDFEAAKAERGFDAELFSKGKFRVPMGFKKIPGASRSGALTPQTRARFEKEEAEGLVELQRDEYGRIRGYREITDVNR